MDGLHVVETADEVDRRVAAPDRARDAGGIAHVSGDELRLAEPAERLQEQRPARFAFGDAHPRAAREQLLHDIAADEAAAAEDRDQLSVEISHRISPW